MRLRSSAVKRWRLNRLFAPLWHHSPCIRAAGPLQAPRCPPRTPGASGDNTLGITVYQPGAVKAFGRGPPASSDGWLFWLALAGWLSWAGRWWGGGDRGTPFEAKKRPSVSPAWILPGLANGGARSRNHKKICLGRDATSRISDPRTAASAHLLDRLRI
jgi:hypothetical protein